jgi:shikimate dehydrogenase
MRVCYLLGYPVGHSMSAVMHNAAFEELGLEYSYDLRGVSPAKLGAFMTGEMRDQAVGGANVTIPHKVAVMEYLDEVDREALAIGAVNTIVNQDGSLKGYNTDGRGAIRALEEAYGELEGVKAVIVGAGGAARAIGYHLSTKARRITILNRTQSRAEKLAAHLSSMPDCNASVEPASLRRSLLEEALKEADILINTTPVGMTPDVEGTPVDGSLIRPGILVFDTVYNPLRTRLLREAEEAGARTLSGLRMLVYQGAAAFKLWTGVEPPVELMYDAVTEVLGGKQR